MVVHRAFGEWVMMFHVPRFPDLEPYGTLCSSGLGVRFRLCFGFQPGPLCCFVVRVSLAADPPVGVSSLSCSYACDGFLEVLEVAPLGGVVLVEVPLVVAMESSIRCRWV